MMQGQEKPRSGVSEDPMLRHLDEAFRLLNNHEQEVLAAPRSYETTRFLTFTKELRGVLLDMGSILWRREEERAPNPPPAGPSPMRDPGVEVGRFRWPW